MRNHLKTIPNQLTAARLIMIPVLWVFAWLKLPVYIGVGMILSFITDALDGYVARKLNQVSDFGSKFDSFVDNLLLPRSGLVVALPAGDLSERT
jgi:phosphatidylglycerophosphate synthase